MNENSAAARQALDDEIRPTYDALMALYDSGRLNGWALVLVLPEGSQEDAPVALTGCCPGHIAKLTDTDLAAVSSDPHVRAMAELKRLENVSDVLSAIVGVAGSEPGEKSTESMYAAFRDDLSAMTGGAIPPHKHSASEGTEPETGMYL